MSRLSVRPLLAAVTIAAGAAAIAASTTLTAADGDLPALQQRIARLEALTQRVEAISAIKRLQHAYGHYSELGLWHDFADLFADSGIGYYTQGALDREGIRSLFLKEVGRGQLGLADGRLYPHISMQPVVTLAEDGQSGKGRWHIMAMLGGYGTSASWAGGIYENQYVRENGVWKVKEVRYLPQYSGRYEDQGYTAAKEPALSFHFDASRVGKPILDLPATPGRHEGAITLAALGGRMRDLAARAQRLADEIEVTNLQHAYGFYVDRKMWDDVADLFAANGTMEIGRQGVYVGQKSIRRVLKASGTLAEGEINDQVHLQTIVTLAPDGRTARARGTVLGMLGKTGGQALWTQSIYENEFVKDGAVWKVTAVHAYPRFIVDAEKGWAKDAQPAPGPSREFPPDRPSTGAYEIYPRFHIAPFHFDHPVTGRPPQYPEGTTVGRVPRSREALQRAAVTRRDGGKAALTTAAALAALVASTERAVERSKAYHAAENLATAYGYYIDEFMWDQAADIFSRDGWKELSYVGAYVGRERVRQSMKVRYPNPKSTNVLTLHQVVQPVIHVSADARTAKIRGRLLQMGGASGGAGSWIAGVYENSAVDEEGTWKLSGMDLDYIWTAPSRGGWVRVTTPPAAPQVAMAKEFPPDRPLRGSIAPPFPKVHTVPFHYKNPVSSRMPPVLLP
jgi:hypothetical protein